MKNRLKQITDKAKQLYKTGKFAKWTDAIKQASKSIGASKPSQHKDTKSHNVRINVVSGNKPTKYVTEYIVQGNYGYGWDDLTSHDRMQDAKKEKKTYDMNERYPHRVITRKVKNENYVGAVKIIQKGESKNAKVTKVLQQTRKKDGTFKGYRAISGLSRTNEIKRLKQLASKSKSPLEKKVATILISNAVGNGYDSLKSYMNDILQHGLQSGIISELIYYHDTLAWYKKYKKEIDRMLYETMYQLGANSPVDVFGRNWDMEDPFANDTANQNLLAWYSFEETTRKLYDELGYDF